MTVRGWLSAPGDVFTRAHAIAPEYFRRVGDTIEILANGSKHNEQTVIRKLQDFISRGVMRIRAIRYLTALDKVNQENDNIDVHVEIDDGRVFSVLIATPRNVFWCMENEDIDYYFGTPTIYVKLLNREYVEKALNAVVLENDGRWLELYGSLQKAT